MHPLVDNYFKAIRKFIPSKPSKTAIGLDIGSSDCKMIEIQKGDDGFELVHTAVEPIKNLNSGVAIKDAVAQASVSSKSVYTSVFGRGTLLRYIEMPKMSLEDLRNSFAIEADKYFPFPADQIYTDCFIVDDKLKGNKMMVMAAACKKKLVDDRVKILTDAGFQVDFIGINSIALTNIIHTLGLPESLVEEKIVALLDMGESVSTLTIMINRIPQFTRDVYMGGQDFTKRIGNALGVGAKEAEAIKRDPQEKKEMVVTACESVMMNIVQELRLSFDYFSTEKNIEIKHLLLTGGASMMGGVPEFLEKNLDLKVHRWNPLEMVVMSEEQKAKIGKDSYKYGVALGLALYDYD